MNKVTNLTELRIKKQQTPTVAREASSRSRELGPLTSKISKLEKKQAHLIDELNMGDISFQ